MKKKLQSKGAAGKSPGASEPVATRRKLSTREIVAATGLSSQRVQQRLKRGETAQEIILAVQSRKDSEQAAVAEEKLHRSRTGGAAAPAPLSYSVRRKAESDAALRALELAARRGELVPAAQISLYVASCIIGARQILESIEDLADDLARETDPIAVRARLRREIVRALHVLEGHGATVGCAVAVSPIDPALPSEVQKAIRVIGKYSISLAGGGM